MINSHLVNNEAEFLFFNKEFKKIINTEKSLPDFIFQKTFKKYWVMRYDCAEELDFGSFLLKISEIYNDESIHFNIIEPDPMHCKNVFSKLKIGYGLAIFNPKDIEATYVNVIWEQGSCLGAGIMNTADKGAFWGSSLKWAIYYDRVFSELAVIATSDEIDLGKIPESYLRKSKLPFKYKNDFTDEFEENFTKKFLGNYPGVTPLISTR